LAKERRADLIELQHCLKKLASLMKARDPA
jgi:hypothetical protein